MTERAAVWRDVAAAAVLAAVPLSAAIVGAKGPIAVRLNLGPGDAPYVRGFTPEYEIDDRVATHWTTYDAGIALPLEVRGPVEASYRFTRSFGETAVVDVALSGRPVDHFTARGGAYLRRRISLGALPPTPLDLAFRVDSHERRNMGLKMDWVRWDVGAGGRVRLAGRARLRAAVAVALAFLILRVAGTTRRAAIAGGAALALLAAGGLAWDCWTTYRLLESVPAVLALGLVLTAAAGVLVRRGRIPADALPGLVVLALIATGLRLAPLNHPDFYYPDLRTHARFALGLREAGVHALLRPAWFTGEYGIWKTDYAESPLVFPYPFAFHLPLALLPVGYDGLLAAMKALAVLVTIVPLLAAWALARRVRGGPWWTAVLMVVVPTYGTRLSLALFAALFGHAFDAAFIAWLARRLPAITAPRVWVRAALFTAACQLAYVSGTLNTAALLLSLAAVLFLQGPDGRRRAGAVLGFAVAGALMSFALYYRDFVPGAVRLAAAGGGGGGGHYPAQSVLAVAAGRTWTFFGPAYILLAGAGLALLLGRRGPAEADAGARTILAAWLAAYVLLLVGRARLPDVFLHGHETLFVTPLVCLASGKALSALAARGGARRAAALTLVTVLAVQGLVWQWRALADQLGNAR